MAEGFDEASTQGFIMQKVNGPAGSTFAVKDASGTLLLSEIVPYEYTSVVASAPGMSIGDNITMMINSEATTLTIDNKTATLEGSRH